MLKKSRDYPLSATPKPVSDSTSFYTKRMMSNMNMADRSTGELKNRFTKKYKEDAANLDRQSKKGKPGYDKMGFKKN